MLLEYLRENYKVNEPIFESDIELPVTNTNLRRMFKVLCDKGEIKRYDKGIYYMQETSRLKGGVSISASEVARYKYIVKRNQVEGYYSGYTFANQLGLTTQVPVTLEIVSNNTSARYREVYLKNQKVILRKPYTEVTNENCYILQLLDLLKDVERYVDDDIYQAAARIKEYMKDMQISRDDIDKYIEFYPNKIYKSIYEMRLY